MKTLSAGGLFAGALLMAALPLPAHAFCGTYVGEPGAELFSGASQVVMVRQGNRTVLTLANDVEGSVKDFAVVIPVPTVLGEDDVAVLDPAVIDTVAEYSGPRLVEYSCSDFDYDYGGGRSGCSGIGCSEMAFSVDSDASFDNRDSLDVTVEAEFAAGEYDIVILSSEDSADLLTWLNQEGYAVSEQAQTLLGEYIAADSKFLAAKVRLEDVPTTGGFEGRPFLSPLQLSYTSETFSLPIRLGTVNSPGTQDLVVYTVTPASEGAAAISNYAETAPSSATFDNECLFDEADQGSIDDYLEGLMDDAVTANDGAAWMRSYSWGPSKCDPCPPGGPLEDDTLARLGFEGDPNDAHFSRLWMRYDADAATQDIMLYGTGNGGTSQLRYIVRKPGLEAYFPVCGEGWIDAADFESCDDQNDDDEAQQGSISPWGLGLGLLGLLTSLGIALRRRS